MTDFKTDAKIKARIHARRNRLGYTARQAAQLIRDLGYEISDGSYRNIETNSKGSARVNLKLLGVIANAFETHVHDLVAHHEISQVPSHPLHHGPRASRKPRTPEKEELIILRQVVRGVKRLHAQDPVDTDCCAGCEMIWPCATRELIDEHTSRMQD